MSDFSQSQFMVYECHYSTHRRSQQESSIKKKQTLSLSVQYETLPSALRFSYKHVKKYSN